MRHPHPAVIEARELIELEELHRAYPDIRRLQRALDLAPTLEVCEAILRGEKIPHSKLDPTHFIRYGIRRAS